MVLTIKVVGRFEAFTVACPGFHQSEPRIPLLYTGLSLYLKSHQQKCWSFMSTFQAGLAIFVNTTEFQKNTKENMPSNTFCSHFSQDGPINIIPSPDCYFFITLSIDTHIGYPGRHISIWSYGHMAIWILCWSIWVSMERATKT